MELAIAMVIEHAQGASQNRDLQITGITKYIHIYVYHILVSSVMIQN